MGNQSLLPVPAIVANDIPKGALVDDFIVVQKACSSQICFIGFNDLGMIL